MKHCMHPALSCLKRKQLKRFLQLANGPITEERQKEMTELVRESLKLYEEKMRQRQEDTKPRLKQFLENEMAIYLALPFLLSVLASIGGLIYLVIRWPLICFWVIVFLALENTMFWGTFWTWVTYMGVGPL